MSNEQAARPLEFHFNRYSIRPWWVPADQLWHGDNPMWPGDNPMWPWLMEREREDADRLRRRGLYGRTWDHPITQEYRTMGWDTRKKNWYLLSETAWHELMRDRFPHSAECPVHEMDRARRWIGQNVGGNCRWLVHDPVNNMAEFRFHAREDHALFMMVWR